MQPAAEAQAAVLLVEGEGEHLQAAGQHRLHGPEVLHPAGGVDVDVGDGRGLAAVHAGKQRGESERGGVSGRARAHAPTLIGSRLHTCCTFTIQLRSRRGSRRSRTTARSP